jgi:hypothetical protein
MQPMDKNTARGWKRKYSRQLLLALLAIFFFYRGDPAPPDIKPDSFRAGKIISSSSRGRYYIEINKKNIFCSEGTTLLSTDCPNPNNHAKLNGKECIAAFFETRTKLLVKQDLLVSLTCEGETPPGFSATELYKHRNREHEWGINYITIPGLMISMILIIFIK